MCRYCRNKLCIKIPVLVNPATDTLVELFNSLGSIFWSSWLTILFDFKSFSCCELSNSPWLPSSELSLSLLGIWLSSLLLLEWSSWTTDYSKLKELIWILLSDESVLFMVLIKSLCVGIDWYFIVTSILSKDSVYIKWPLPSPFGSIYNS